MKTIDGTVTNETAQRKLVLHIIQPGLAGLMDGSVSSFLYLLRLIQHTMRTQHLLSVWLQLRAPVSVGFFRNTER